jgi:hypothetical protein
MILRTMKIARGRLISTRTDPGSHEIGNVKFMHDFQNKKGLKPGDERRRESESRGSAPAEDPACL